MFSLFNVFDGHVLDDIQELKSRPWNSPWYEYKQRVFVEPWDDAMKKNTKEPQKNVEPISPEDTDRYSRERDYELVQELTKEVNKRLRCGINKVPVDIRFFPVVGKVALAFEKVGWKVELNRAIGPSAVTMIFTRKPIKIEETR